MKFIFAAAVALAAAFTAPAVATATPAPQDRVVVRERTFGPGARNTRVVVRERSTTRRAYGYGRQPRRVCTVRYRRGQRVRTCRTVNGRY